MRKPNWSGFWEKQRIRFLFGLFCLGGAVALGRVAVIAQTLPPWQNFWIVFLFALFLIWAAVATYVAKEYFAQAVSNENVEGRVNEWILKFRFVSQNLADSSCYWFAYGFSVRDGRAVVVGVS